MTEWWQIALSLVGGIGGVGGVMSIYTAKANKNSIEIENFRRLFDEAQEERENMKHLYMTYEEKTDAKIKELEQKLNFVERKNTSMVRAVNSAYRCSKIQDKYDCPVLKTLDDEIKEKNKNCGQ